MDQPDTQLLLYIVRFYEQHGYGPRHDDLTEAFGMSRNTVNRRRKALRDQGFVTWQENSRGTLRPLVSEVPFKR